ncbi:MAG: Retinol dehydrogenase 14 [Tardiphaga sp.]|uniref:SDR family NAD(P)-dependent oxidoreductase n=1 Tax=Tardiphaga sp. TaxID=1926292 RepID=UPI002635D9D3|nr:SDR family NAD(P)-dependent oxidoreductase [Tardiphaga sp.]MDB5500953.1 Retinol dehydrogenase 14 [Tardiphaga sp.]
MPQPVPTMVITGATGGIGQRAALALARQGAHLVLTARSRARAKATVQMIEAAAPGTRVDVYYGDFSDLASVAALGREIAARHARIDVLVNNAGIHAFAPRITADGYAEMVAVNYLAPWLLTDMLRDTLLRSAPSRIVAVASEASRQGAGFDPVAALDDIRPFTARGSSAIYGRTKLLDIMFSQELARQFEGRGVAVNCLCPGFNVTGLGRELWFAAPLQRLLAGLGIGDPARGAAIIVRLARDPAFAEVTGGYFSVQDARPLVPVSPGADRHAQQALWQATAERLARWSVA